VYWKRPVAVCVRIAGISIGRGGHGYVTFTIVYRNVYLRS
jgi:hypothetical protein